MARVLHRRDFLKSAATTAAAAGLVAPLGAHSAAASTALSGVKISEVKTFLMPGAIFVKVTTDSGLSGWGECAEDNTAVMETFIHNGIKRQVLGSDPFDIEPIWDRMFYRNHDLGPGGSLANAIAGVDIALWDLKGKLLGLPAHKLMGGRYRDRILAYGSFGVGAGKKLTTKEAARQAAKFVKDGFRVVKLRMQIREYRLNPDPDPTFDYVKAVKKAIGDDAELFVDINNGYSAGRAVQVGKRLYEEYGIRFFEEPCSDQNHAETRHVVNELQDSLVIAGEKEYTRWQIKDLITEGNPDILNPDPIKAGGLTEMKKIAAIAQAFTKPIVCHNTRPTLSTAAALQFVASISNCGPFLEFPDVDHYRHLLAVMQENIVFSDGHLLVPDSPGIGINVDEGKLTGASTSIQA